MSWHVMTCISDAATGWVVIGATLPLTENRSFPGAPRRSPYATDLYSMWSFHCCYRVSAFLLVGIDSRYDCKLVSQTTVWSPSFLGPFLKRMDVKFTVMWRFTCYSKIDIDLGSFTIITVVKSWNREMHSYLAVIIIKLRQFLVHWMPRNNTCYNLLSVTRT